MPSPPLLLSFSVARGSGLALCVSIKQATQTARIHKRLTCHAFRHSFATKQLKQRIGLPTIQKPSAHSPIKTTQIYTHVVGLNHRTVPAQ